MLRAAQVAPSTAIAELKRSAKITLNTDLLPMESAPLQIFVWLVLFGTTWISVRSVLEVFKDQRTDFNKATWISIIVCLPMLGPLLFVFLGGTSSSRDELIQKDAAIKARFNSGGN